MPNNFLSSCAIIGIKAWLHNKNVNLISSGIYFGTRSDRKILATKLTAGICYRCANDLQSMNVETWSTMESIKSLNYHPVPAVRTSKVKQTNGMQKLYTKIINKIEDLPPKLQTKLHSTPQTCSLVRNSPVNRPVTKVKRPNSPVIKRPESAGGKNDSMILSDDDEFYSKLTFDDSEQSLEDEIFEELEKVAHDEAKLNAAIQNFDRILFEYNDKKKKELKAVEAKRDEKPSAIPKPLQKSKTCSIIESKCILKKQDEKKKSVPKKVEKPLNVENFGSITSANYYQVTKSLWNLQDFDEFAKSAKQKTQLGPRKSEGSVPSKMCRAKSVWDMTPTTATPPQRPSYSRQSSISKIPIKSSKLSSSMMQLNASNSTLNLSYSSPSPRLSNKSSSVYASALSLTSSIQTPAKVSSIRRSSLCLTSRKPESPSPKSISKYSETKKSIQRRNMISSTNSINKMSISIAPSRASPLKSAKSEMSINGRFTQQQQSKQKFGAVDLVQPNRLAATKVKRDNESLLDKCLVKGQELLKKAEELNEVNRVHDKAKIFVVAADVRKRDYIAKHQPASLPLSSTKDSSTVSMNTKSSSANVNSIKNHHNVTNETLLNVNAITNHCTVDNQTGNHQQRQIESEKTSKPVFHSTARTTEIITNVDVSQSPTLESCEIIPVVLDDANKRSVSIEKAADVGDTKDYSSDCSDDSGHISNENEDLTLKMDLKKPTPRKISEELLEIFEQKKISPVKAKVIELNQVNLIKTSMEIYPTLNKTCKSEVTFFINKYWGFRTHSLWRDLIVMTF